MVQLSVENDFRVLEETDVPLGKGGQKLTPQRSEEHLVFTTVAFLSTAFTTGNGQEGYSG